jgi:hypothetical protein
MQATPAAGREREVGDFLKTEIARWAPVVKASGARAD